MGRNEYRMLEANVKVIKLNEEAILPTYGSVEAAGADLYSAMDDLVIAPGETILVKTGIAMEIPKGYAGFIYARSGLATKRGLAPANKVGVIDSDYRGEIMVALHNHSNIEQTVERHERIAQLVIEPYLKAVFEVAKSLEETKRGTGGFGSTGTK